VKKESQDILQAQDQRETEDRKVCTVDHGFSSCVPYEFVPVCFSSSCVHH